MNLGTRMTLAGAFDHIETLDEVVDDFINRLGAAHHDPIVAYAKKAPDIFAAIARACDNRREDGVMFAMGSCVRTSSRNALKKALLKKALVIGNLKNFDDLYDLVRLNAPWGIGDMTSYCTATRIGAYLGLEPKAYLYLHAGPLRGWNRLTGAWGSRFRVPWAEVPAPLRRLSPRQVEDCLCEYRDLLHPGMIR